MPKWRVFYDNGDTFSSDDGTPDEARPEGFICAVGYDQRGKRYIMHGWDFYGWDKETEQWWGCTIFGLMDRLRRRVVYGFAEGRTVDTPVFKRLMQRAHEDPDFPLP